VRPSSCNFVRIDHRWLARSGGFAPISLPLYQGSRRVELLDGFASLSIMSGLLVRETDQYGSFLRKALIARQLWDNTCRNMVSRDAEARRC
jgi:hypothetical protein